MTNRKITETAIIASLAIVLGYVETFIPIPIPIPGIKIGLSNMAILFALYRINEKSALGVMVIKVVVSAMLFSGFSAFLYSISGGILSYFSMIMIKKILPVTYVSVAGGIFHNIGQILMATLMLRTISVFWYFPYLLISGIITGYLIGIVTKLILKYIK